MSALVDDAQGLNGADGLRHAEAAQRLLKMRAARAGAPPMVDGIATVRYLERDQVQLAFTGGCAVVTLWQVGERSYTRTTLTVSVWLTDEVTDKHNPRTVYARIGDARYKLERVLKGYYTAVLPSDAASSLLVRVPVATRFTLERSQ